MPQLPQTDNGEADDKIISVLENDHVWGHARDIRDVPPVLVERLQHYFLTYKLVPGRRALARVATAYGRVHALKVVRAAMADYDDTYAVGGPIIPLDGPVVDVPCGTTSGRAACD